MAPAARRGRGVKEHQTHARRVELGEVAHKDSARVGRTGAELHVRVVARLDFRRHPRRTAVEIALRNAKLVVVVVRGIDPIKAYREREIDLRSDLGVARVVAKLAVRRTEQQHRHLDAVPQRDRGH